MKEETRVRLEALEQAEKQRRRARWAWLRHFRLGSEKAIVERLVLAFVVFLVVMLAMAAGGEGLVGAGLLVVGSLFVYFAPALVADHRKHPAKSSIFVVNLFLGWTLLGWVVALAWAVSKPPPPRE